MSRETLTSPRKRLYEVDPHCRCCGRPVRYGKCSLDHLVSVSRGGDDPGNLVPCCQHCNQSKADSTPLEWAASILSAVPIC